MRASRRAVLAFTLAAGALASSTAFAEEPLKIRIGWGSMPAHLIPALYVDKTPLKHYGKSYTVEPVRFGGSTPQITALASGDIDLAAFSPAAFVLGIVNARLDLRVVADVLQDGKPGHYSQSIYVKADGPIKTVQDLKGKIVAVNAIGSAVDNAVRAMLAKNGMDPKKDVRVIEASFANVLPMLNDGKIDAGPVQQPMASELVKQGKLRLLFSSADAMGPTQFVFLVGRKKFLDEHKEALQDFFEDHVRAIRWITDPKNRDKALPIIAKESVRPVEQMNYLFTDLDYFRDPSAMPDIPALQQAIDVSADLEVVPKTIKVSPDYLDLSFVEEAKKRIDANP
jgi:NitT/TauT family transport system substrate-binding protein